MAGMTARMRPQKASITESRTGDRQADDLQRRITEALRLLSAIPFLSVGRLISCRFPLASTDYAFEHGLGAPAAAFIVRANYEATTPLSIAESGPVLQNAIPQDRCLGLRSSAAGTVDIWFYPRASLIVDLNRSPQQSR